MPGRGVCVHRRAAHDRIVEGGRCPLYPVDVRTRREPRAVPARDLPRRELCRDQATRMSDSSLDLDAYLARIGHRGSVEPTVATLRSLHFAHVTHVPFENLDIL